jgi:hypothetical protein
MTVIAGSAQGPIQQAIYEILTADPTLMSLVTGVFDFVPDNQNFPYIHLAKFKPVSSFGTSDHYGQEVRATIFIWNQRIGPNAYQGYKQIDEIMNAIQRLLVWTFFPIQGWHNAGCWPEDEDTFLDSDGITRHGSLIYKIRALKKGRGE